MCLARCPCLVNWSLYTATRMRVYFAKAKYEKLSSPFANVKEGQEGGGRKNKEEKVTFRWRQSKSTVKATKLRTRRNTYNPTYTNVVENFTTESFATPTSFPQYFHNIIFFFRRFLLSMLGISKSFLREKLIPLHDLDKSPRKWEKKFASPKGAGK